MILWRSRLFRGKPAYASTIYLVNTSTRSKSRKSLLLPGLEAEYGYCPENAGVEYDRSGIHVDTHLTGISSPPGQSRVDLNQLKALWLRAKISSLTRGRSLLPDSTPYRGQFWTTPEIATVGLNETDLVRRRYQIPSLGGSELVRDAR